MICVVINDHNLSTRCDMVWQTHADTHKSQYTQEWHNSQLGGRFDVEIEFVFFNGCYLSHADTLTRLTGILVTQTR